MYLQNCDRNDNKIHNLLNIKIYAFLIHSSNITVKDVGQYMSNKC